MACQDSIFSKEYSLSFLGGNMQHILFWGPTFMEFIQ